MLSNLLQTAYNIVDAFWLGKLGKEALAAPTLSWPIIFLVISIGAGMGVAGTALVAQYKGANRIQEAHRTAGQVLFFVLLTALILGSLGYLLAGTILSWMGATTEVIDLATAYMQIIFIGMPLMFGFFIFTALLRGWGDTVTPMKLMAFSVVLNVVLDPLFIFGWGFFPKWEVAGAALATVFSRAVVTIFGLWLLFSGKVGIKLNLFHLLPDWSTIKKIINVGIPSSIGQSSTALGFSVMMGIVAMFGTATISAFGVGNRIISLAMMPAMGLGMATTTMVGQNLGRDLPKRAAEATWASVGIVTAILLAGALIAFVIPKFLVRIFITDPKVVKEGVKFFRLVSFSIPFAGILQVMMGTFRGAGHTMYSMGFTIVRLWLFRLPLAYLLGAYLGWASGGVWWSMVLSNFGAALVSVFFFLQGSWRKKVIEEKAPPTKIYEEA